MMQRLDIIPMTEEHIRAAADIEKECFSVPWSEKMLLDAIKVRTGVYLVAISNSCVCGYIGADFVLEAGYITNVAVKECARRIGVAAALVTALIEKAKKTGLKYLTLEVRPSNAPAIALYKRFGFNRVGVRRGYYDNPAEDAEIMTSTL